MVQINLNSKWFTLIKYFVFAIIFHLVISWFGGCSNGSKQNVQKVVIPAVHGSFNSIKPESKPLEIKVNPILQTKKDGLVYVENPLNKKLLEENNQLKIDFALLKSDSLKQKTYEKAIELNSFSSKFQDKNIKLTINGIVRGEVQEITPVYEIKERETIVQVPSTVLRVLAGGSIGINKDLNQMAYKAGIDFQNKKGNIISAEYLNVNNQGYGMIGFKKSIFNIKR